MTKRSSLWLFIAAAVICVIALSVLVNAVRSSLRPLIDTSNVIYNDSYRQTDDLAGDLVVVGTSITIDANVDGDAALIGDQIIIRGEIAGDLAVVASDIQLENAVVRGDVVLLGSTMQVNAAIEGELAAAGDTLIIAESSQIDTTINACTDSVQDQRGGRRSITCTGDPVLPVIASLIALRTGEIAAGGVSALTIGLSGVFFSLLMAGAASLAVTLFPRQISRIEEAIRFNPRHLAGVGIAIFLLGIGLSAALIVLLALLPPVGILLIPVYLIAGLGLLALLLTGWVTLALVVGDLLIARLSRSAPGSRRIYPPLIHAAVGSFVLSVLMTILVILPFGAVIAFILSIVLLSVGVGAAMFTRLGTRSLTRATFVQG